MGSDIKDASALNVRVWGAHYNDFAQYIGKGPVEIEYKFSSKEDAEHFASSYINAKSWPNAYVIEVELNLLDIWRHSTYSPACKVISCESLSDRARTRSLRTAKEKQLQDLQRQMETLERDLQKMP